MKEIVITRPGDVDVLKIREAPDPRPGNAEVVINVAAIGVNFADVLARMGAYPDAPPIPCVVGYEVSGTVRETGKDVTRVKPGDRVVAATRFGGYTTVALTPEALVFPMPEGMSFEEGAALPVNYMTAYLALFVMGNLREGESVLIHSAGGGVGMAAVQLARTRTEDIYGTASEGKHQRLREMGVRHPIDYRSVDFEEAVRTLSGGKGVRLILDPIGGRSIKKDRAILAPLGRIVLFGLQSAFRGGKRSMWSIIRALLQMPRFSPLHMMGANTGLWGLNVGHLWDEIPTLSGAMTEVLRLYEAGAVKPEIAATYGFEEAAEAHRCLQERRNVGKVLLTTGP